MNWSMLKTHMLAKGKWAQNKASELCQIMQRHPDTLNELSITQFRQSPPQEVPYWAISSTENAFVTMLDITSRVQAMLAQHDKENIFLQKSNTKTPGHNLI